MVGTIEDAVAKGREQSGEPEQHAEEAEADAEPEQAEEPEAVPA
jgi:hypothetical protein